MRQRETAVSRARLKDEEKAERIREKILREETRRKELQDHVARMAQMRRDLVVTLEMQAEDAKKKIAELRSNGQLLDVDLKNLYSLCVRRQNLI